MKLREFNNVHIIYFQANFNKKYINDIRKVKNKPKIYNDYK